MTDKIVRADSTVVSNIKSCTFKEQVNTEENLRFGACAASSIEFEVFGSQANAIPAGEELTYYQTDDNNVDTLIGVFTAQPSIPSRNTYKIVAYDNIIKLETDFSEHLASIQSSFPMTLSALLAEVATVAGVTFGNSPTLASTTIQEFSANGVSCRQVVAWAAEMSGQYVHCDTNGDILFGWYAARSGYSVRPGSGSSGGVTYVPYREGGLNYKDYAVSAVDRVAVKPPEEEDVAYIYPTSATGNTYVVSNNLLLTNAESATMNTVAQTLYGVLSAMPTYRPASISLFRFDNPFRAGDVVSVTDVQGVTFNTLVMSMTVSLDGASVECTGKETYDSDSGGGVSQQLVNLANNIVRINKLKVDWADINTAIINYLTANNVTAQNLTIVDENDNVLATFNSSGITFYNGGVAVANYNNNAVVLGETSNTHAEIDYNSFELYDRDGTLYASIGDLRDASGFWSLEETITKTSAGTYVNVAYPIASITSITIDGVAASGYTFAGVRIVFTSTIPAGSVVVVNYSTASAAYHYDLGSRRSGTLVALDSFVAGSNQEASGRYSSVSGGIGNTASGNCATVNGGGGNSATGDYSAVVCGYGNTASNYSATVSGGYSNTASAYGSAVCGGQSNTASGTDSTVAAGVNNVASERYAIVSGGQGNVASGYRSSVGGGYSNTASGYDSSVPCGSGNEANHKSQFVFGEYNVLDTSGRLPSYRGNYIEIVGNGTADNARSNARTLDWSGNETLAGMLYVNGGTPVMTSVSDTGWISIPLASNITAATADGSEAGGGLYYRVVNGNHVYVRGGLNVGTYSGSAITLSSSAIPAAYRPVHTAYDWSICNGRYLGRAFVSAATGLVSLGYVQLLTDTSNTSSATITNFVINIDYFLN